MHTTTFLLSSLFTASLALAAAQTPGAPVTPASPAAAETKPVATAKGTWVTAEGHGPGRQDALAAAIESAVMQVHGVGVAKGSTLKARLAVAKRGDENQATDAVLEVGRVTQQLEGFVLQMEQPTYTKVEDGWQATVRCLVADYDAAAVERFVVQFREVFPDGGTQHTWVLGDARNGAALTGSDLATRLTNTQRIVLSAAGRGVAVRADSARAEAAKQGQALVASHAIEVAWSPVVVDVMDRPTLPGARRKQALVRGAMRGTIQVVDLVGQSKVVDATFEVAIPAAEGTANSEANRDELLRRVLSAANDEVVMKVCFALRPPKVLAVTKGEGEQPAVIDVDIPFDFADQMARLGGLEFQKETSLGDARTVSLGGALLLPADRQPTKGATRVALGPGVDPSTIEVGVARLGRKPQ